MPCCGGKKAGENKMDTGKKIAGNLTISFLIAITVIFLIVATTSL
jgi:hypothetical protein